MRAIVWAGVFAVLVAVPVAAAPMTCRTLVFEDRDGDGRRDRDEPGIAGVALWAAPTLHRTGDDGVAVVPVRAGDRIALVKPAGWLAARRADGLPDTWREASGRRRCAVAFALRRDPRPAGELDVLLFADPQPKDARQVGLYGRGIVDAVRAAHPGDGPPAHLGLTLGDIVDDAVSLYPAMNALTTSLGVPWLHVPGNHDVDVAAPHDEGSLRTFHATFGPDTTAWEEHEAVFIGLDDVIWRPGGDVRYVGGLREDQFAFLAAYLAEQPAMRPIVIAVHIPFFDTKAGEETFRRADRERLFALLDRFEHVRLLSAHGHVQRHYWHDAADGWRGASPLHEYNLGAACGSYWGGVEDAAGVPTSAMEDGTPKGWGEMTLRPHGAATLRWNVAEAGVAPATPMALHAPKVLRRGSYPGFAVYANVFMGFAQARVEYRVGEGDWRPMTRVEVPDPRIVAQNVADDAADTLRVYDRLPEAAPSTHLWRGTLPTDLAAGPHRVQVRAYDPWRGEVEAETVYSLVDAVPKPAPAGGVSPR